MKKETASEAMRRETFFFALHINSIFQTTGAPRACLHLREKDGLLPSTPPTLLLQWSIVSWCKSEEC